MNNPDKKFTIKESSIEYTIEEIVYELQERTRLSRDGREDDEDEYGEWYTIQSFWPKLQGMFAFLRAQGDMINKYVAGISAGRQYRIVKVERIIDTEWKIGVE